VLRDIFKNAEWIWHSEENKANEYGEFYSEFEYSGGSLTLKIAADSNYAAYINGTLAAFGQYADFPYDKVCDKVDVSAFCREGKNSLAVIVWYYGIDTTQVYYKGEAGVIFELENNGEIALASGENILSRLSRAYCNYGTKIITGQLGLSFAYDLTKEDDWLKGELDGFHPSVKADIGDSMRYRPCEKLVLENAVCGKEVKKLADNDIVFDLESEQVGFIDFEIESDCEQDVLFSYGEHIEDGCVRRKIGSRDFSFDIRLRKGNNAYMNPFRRLGVRYIQITSEKPICIKRLSVVPTMYPLAEKKAPSLSESRKEIYDICVNTLKLCMHEHYEDCPWREQALYAMDSRNQILCGYYAFGETRFPRSALQLMSKDNRADGLLSICYPINRDLVIPSFSLHYITECKEYLQYTGDKDFLREIYPKLVSVLETFLKRMKDGLVPGFDGGKAYWNFYEWCDGLDGNGINASEPDVILNSLLSLSLRNMAFIADALGVKNDYIALAGELNGKIREKFYMTDKGLFANDIWHKKASVLGNSLAVLCGAAEDPKAVCEKMLGSNDITDISLSMRCFKYDALLYADKEKYREFILNEIDENYEKMVALGNRTVWETDIGQSDFGLAGSLCHGWSAMPVYYYHILCND